MRLLLRFLLQLPEGCLDFRERRVAIFPEQVALSPRPDRPPGSIFYRHRARVLVHPGLPDAGVREHALDRRGRGAAFLLPAVTVVAIDDFKILSR